MKRALATAAFSFAGAVYIGQYLLGADRLLWAAAVCALFIIVGFFLPGLRPARRTVVFFCVFMAAGFIYLYGYTAFFLAPAEKLDGQQTVIRAEVIAYAQPETYGARTVARVYLPDDRFGRTVKTTLYLRQDAPELLPGDQITCTALLSSTEDSLARDTLSWQRSKGVFLRAVQKGALTLERPKAVCVKYYPVILAQRLKTRMQAIYSQNVAALMQALILGDTAQLSDSLSGALSVTGLSHIVSVSGMHVVFLTGMVLLLVRNKRRATLIAIPVIVLFMAITNFPPSVVRAGLMQILALTAFLAGREKDAVTAIGLALGLILIANPFAATDVGLQLSFCATAGMLLFSQKLCAGMLGVLKKDAGRAAGAVLRFLASSLSSTVSAMVFTLPLAAYYFGTVSLVSPAANLLTIWAVSALFCVGFVSALAALVWVPAGMVLGFAALPFAKYFMWVTGVCSKLPFAAVDAKNPYILSWLFYVYAVACLYLTYALYKKREAGAPVPEKPGQDNSLLDKKESGTVHTRRFLLPGCLAGCALLASLLLSAFSLSGQGLNVAVLDVGQGQCIVLTSNAYTAVIDCGGNKSGGAGVIAARYLKGLGRSEVDLLMLTHYHDDHANGVTTLLGSVHVKNLALPAPDAQAKLSEEILALAQKERIPVTWVKNDTDISMGDALLTLYAPEADAPGVNERGVCMLIKCGDFEALVTGDLNLASERRLAQRVAFPNIELIVAGHHGSKYASSEELLEETRPDVAIVSVGRNRYGHPTAQALERLRDTGAKIYRTDENGTVRVSAAA